MKTQYKRGRSEKIDKNEGEYGQKAMMRRKKRKKIRQFPYLSCFFAFGVVDFLIFARDEWDFAVPLAKKCPF